MRMVAAGGEVAVGAVLKAKCLSVCSQGYKFGELTLCDKVLQLDHMFERHAYQNAHPRRQSHWSGSLRWK